MLLLRNVFLFAALAVSKAVKVNMMGSLSLGQDVMDVLKEYVVEKFVEQGARRAMEEPDDIPSIVKHDHLCRDIPFCSGAYEKTINDYIAALYRAISGVFEGALNGEVFKLKSKQCLRDVKQILKRVDSKVSEDNEFYGWTSVLKNIGAAFLERAYEYLIDRVDSNLEKKDAVVRILSQQLVVGVAKVEMHYQNMFCTEYSVCPKKFQCTKALNELLSPMDGLEDYKVRAFIHAFKENSASTTFMLRLDDTIREEFERILDSMARDNSPAKNILNSVKKSIEQRLAGKEPRGNDIILMNIILSDMDHVFEMRKRPFEHFLSNYDRWVRTGDDLESNMKHLFTNLTVQLNEHSFGFTSKLFNEAKVFLELTIGSAGTK